LCNPKFLAGDLRFRPSYLYIKMRREEGGRRWGGGTNSALFAPHLVNPLPLIKTRNRKLADQVQKRFEDRRGGEAMEGEKRDPVYGGATEGC